MIKKTSLIPTSKNLIQVKKSIKITNKILNDEIEIIFTKGVRLLNGIDQSTNENKVAYYSVEDFNHKHKQYNITFEENIQDGKIAKIYDSHTNAVKYIILSEDIKNLYSFILNNLFVIQIGVPFGENNLLNYDKTFIIINYYKLYNFFPEYTVEFIYYETNKNTDSYIEAVKIFSNILEKKPLHTLSLEMRSRAKYKIKDFNGSLEDLNLAIKINSKNPYLLRHRARLKYAQKDYLGAIIDLEKAIELNVKIFKFHIELAEIKIKIRDFKGAILECSKVISLNKYCFFAYLRRSEVYYHLGNLPNAILDMDFIITNLEDNFDIEDNNLIFFGRIKSREENLKLAYCWRAYLKDDAGDSLGAENDREKFKYLFYANRSNF